jgi:hypothetical protein
MKALNKRVTLLLAIILSATTSIMSQKQNVIKPGDIWPDNNGKHIQAHGGGIIKIGKTY